MARWEFGIEDPEEPRYEPGESERCTPELLLGFIRETRARTGKSPTLKDCKERFGGIIGPLMDAWTLRERGLL
jgi:hypothetical protein